MPVIYVGLGIFFIVTEYVFNFSKVQQIGFGTILITYGLIRFYVSIRKKRESELENEDKD